jgi:hypothetical protein
VRGQRGVTPPNQREPTFDGLDNRRAESDQPWSDGSSSRLTAWKASEFDIWDGESASFTFALTVSDPEPKDFFCGWRTQTSARGVVSLISWPCGQDSRPQPECHQRRSPAPRGGGRGLLVLTAGPGWVTSTGPTRPGGRGPASLNARGFWPSYLPRAPNRGTGRPESDAASAGELGSPPPRRVQSRWGIPAVLAGGRCPATSKRTASG